ncbi:MAG TPA: heat-inducible transcriptional repressor HrcA [Thermoanaerobaculaceae bacterium]|nr:heat-inducible transcriptional repressor HrcA [Thermoanaerobaculaceae bacterium]
MKDVLSDREREILCEIVESYLASGEPVASATLARTSRTGLSSASLRSVMADLEEKGFLLKPHTSAGRIPSDLGFRLYIDRLLQGAALSHKDSRRLKSMLSPMASLEEVLAQASRVLADVTAEMGMAMAPASRQATLQSIHFVRVAQERVLAVVVTGGGLVDSRLLATERDFAPAELERISNYCTQSFAGLVLREIGTRLLALMAEERAQADELLSGVVALGHQAVAAESTPVGEVFFNGADRLLERAAPGQLQAVRRLLAAFSDKAALLSLLNGYLAYAGPRVLFGSEFSLVGGDDLGLIVTTFHRSSGEDGLIGVVGLKRMDYPRIIPIVDYIGQYITGTGAEPGGVE